MPTQSIYAKGLLAYHLREDGMTEAARGFGPAVLVDRMPVKTIEAMYAAKCGAEVDFSSLNVAELELHECSVTGVRFWRPQAAAGDEAFYQQLASKWPPYYRESRWEYGPALALVSRGSTVLEVGCGRGFFLRTTEAKAGFALGLEFNRNAIAQKVTRWEIELQSIEDVAERYTSRFDMVCSFQVLEHIVDFEGFIRSCMRCVRPGGYLLFSTPNPNYGPHRRREDAFDLPPHHMNYFSHESYRRIAELLGLDLVALKVAPAVSAFAGPAPIRSLRGLVRRIKLWRRDVLARLAGEQGPTTLVVFRNSGSN